jgi:hypothetical protein
MNEPQQNRAISIQLPINDSGIFQASLKNVELIEPTPRPTRCAVGQKERKALCIPLFL